MSNQPIQMDSQEQYDLIKSAQNGNQEAMYELFISLEDYTYKNALFFTRNPLDAEDVAVETLIRIGNNISKFNWKCSFKTWIGTVLRNYFFDWKKKKDRSIAVDFTTIDNVNASANRNAFEIDEFVTNKMFLENFIEFLNQQNKDLREVLLYRYVYMLEYKEIHELTGIKMNTIASYINRSREMIAHYLIDYFELPADKWLEQLNRRLKKA